MKRTAMFMFVLFVLIISIAFMATVNWPYIDRAFTNKAEYAGGQNILHVPAGGDLQQAIDTAQPGYTITLDPGAVYSGNFILRNKPGDEFVTITTAGADPLEGTRITPQAATSLACHLNRARRASLQADEPGDIRGGRRLFFRHRGAGVRLCDNGGGTRSEYRAQPPLHPR
jgi:hypothetical protein